MNYAEECPQRGEKLDVDLEESAIVGGQELIVLSSQEAILLSTLLKRSPNTVAHEALFSVLWPSGERPINPLNNLRSTICQLRKKADHIGAKILPVDGEGYRVIRPTWSDAPQRSGQHCLCGRKYDLPPRQKVLFDLLRQSAPKLVSYETIYATVWPNDLPESRHDCTKKLIHRLRKRGIDVRTRAAIGAYLPYLRMRKRLIKPTLEVDLGRNVAVAGGREVKLRPQRAEILHVIREGHPRFVPTPTIARLVFGIRDVVDAEEQVRVEIVGLKRDIAALDHQINSRRNLGYRVEMVQ